LLDLLSGKIDLRKLASGLARASTKEAPTDLAARLAAALSTTRVHTDILVATRDTTALAFIAAWKSNLFDDARKAAHIRLSSTDTASHSFADATSKAWLYRQIEDCLKQQDLR
jgi:hypothetical protein